MKKLISVGLFVFLAAASFAAPQEDTTAVGQWVERILTEQERANLKSYYPDKKTADLCESWRSCAKWAFEEYVNDQSFQITKAEIKTMRRIYRHRVTKETHLFVEAAYKHRTVRLEFITPVSSGRTRPYHYIAQFPK